MDSVAADDLALCRYSAGASDTPAYRQCRSRLDGLRGRAMAFNATQIDTANPTTVALVRPATTVATCKTAGDCPPPPGDVTGSVPPRPPKF